MKEEEIKKYANKLLIDLTKEELDGLTEEFNDISKQMDLINKIDGLENIEPMHMVPFSDEVILRNDLPEESLSKEEILKNSDDVLNDEVKVPRVVG